MITIDFFDANQRFVVRHKIEIKRPCKFPILLVRNYCKSVFYWYKVADSAVIHIDGINMRMQRNG
jgi:hypothetical protein